jgi:hypothetical protein
MATAQSSHRFDQASWRVIKEFVGIYGIKMDYTKITKLSRDKLSKAYFVAGKQPRPETSILVPIQYDMMGNAYVDVTTKIKWYRTLNTKSASEWKALILKRAAQGYKNRQFYEAVAKMVAHPPKVTCVCGLKIGPNVHQQDAHFRTRNHVNRMLKCVPLSKVAGSKVPVWNRMGNSHTLVVRKWSNQQRQFLVKQVDLRPYMEQREITQSQIYNYCSTEFDATIELTNKMKKNLKWDRTYYTMDHILAGGWCPC